MPRSKDLIKFKHHHYTHFYIYLFSISGPFILIKISVKNQCRSVSQSSFIKYSFAARTTSNNQAYAANGKKPNVISTLVFTADNNITEEALLACKACGIEPAELLGQ